MSKKILGLDLGTNSIGWALIEVDGNNKPIRIIAMGSRIIPLSSDDRDQFQKGQAISKNQDRTIRRTQRKGYDRKQLKKSELKRILKELNIFPSEELMKLPSLALWKLRSDAVTEDISVQQLGRILYMLNQKRGYKSARSEENQDKKDTEYVAEVKGRFAQLKESGQTIGQYFYENLATANRNNSYFRIKEKVYPREAYIEEFDSIINTQRKKHDFLTDEVISMLRNEIVYYQRNLKSQKGLVSICEFEGFETSYIDKETLKKKTVFVGPRVAPKTSPLFQLCKIWENVNNVSLKIKNPQGTKYKWADRIPTIEEKKEIANYLFQNSTLTFAELLKILKLKKDDVYANKQLLKGIQGNITYFEIEKIVGSKSSLLKFEIQIIPGKHPSVLVDKKTGEVLAEEESLQVIPSLEKEPLYQLWHTIYSIKDLNECKSALIKRFAIDEEVAENLSKIDFNKQSFGNKSNKAIRKILPYLMQGYDYSQACSLAGYNHSNSLTKDEQEKRLTADKLELLPKNSLRQPVVEKIINQMINVVNAVLDKHDKPDEIRIELARELKQSKDERNDDDKRNSDNKRLHDEIANRLTELKLPATKRYIQKYKFIFPSSNRNLKDAQATNQCIYCGEHFNLSEALSGDNFDIDHIVPKALLFDDSQTNKVLVHRKCNSTKTNQTAYDYISKKGEKQLNEYLNRVDDWFKKGIISYGKMQRLKVSYEEYLERKKNKKETEADKKIWENFIDRQLRESQYIARKSKEILQQICNNVTATEGAVTAKLRKLWGWDDVLMNLQLPKYKELDQIIIKEWTSDHGQRKHRKEEIANWSKRDDHRHHAIDALVIASTKQGYIQRINTLNSSETKDEMQKEIDAAKSKFGKDYDENILKETNENVKNHSGRLTQLDEYLITEKPFTTAEVSKEAERILISFKAGKKVSTNGVRKVKINGKKRIVQKDILVPRGALHEQSVYGIIKAEDKNKSKKYLFENPEKIINEKIRNLIESRLKENDNDPKKAIATLKNEPIYLDEKKEQILENASCYKEEYVIKYPIQNLKAKDVPFIVDAKVRALIKERLEQHNNNEKEAFKNTVWFNEKKQIPILTVRCYTGLSAVEAIKKDENGKDIGFVVLGNNHHIAIYKDDEGKQVQHSCTFWNAVERKKYKIPPIVKSTHELWNSLLNKELPQSFLDKLPADNLELLFSMQQNEMFVLELSQEEFDEAVKQNNKPLLSKHLYLVWSISDGDYWFRHHLETKNSDLKKIIWAKESKRYYRFRSLASLIKENPIKIRLNHLGEITKIGE
jgi:CRISPR-associated endonuclease Csn1